MTETKVFADDFSCSFRDPNQFLDFLSTRKENSEWLQAPSKSLQFSSIAKGSDLGNLYMQIYEHDGRAEVLADTMENTSLLLKVNGDNYPVRSCALKTILERARISGHALSKVSKEVYTQILNYCLDVASGNSLIKVADEKISAVHGGDPKDYCVLEMLPLFQKVKDYLELRFPGCQFVTAKSDPFQLCKIKGFGFLTVDAIARKTKVSLRNPLRYAGAIDFALEEARKSGHLFLYRNELVGECHELLNRDCEQEMVTADDIRQALLHAHQEGEP